MKQQEIMEVFKEMFLPVPTVEKCDFRDKSDKEAVFEIEIL